MQKSIVFIFFLFLVGLPLCNAQWSYTTLSVAKNGMGVAVIDNKIFFHCGTKKVGSTQVYVNTVDIFDVRTGARQTMTLPAGSARSGAATAVVGTKLIFAGGDNGDASNNVDIYDTTTGVWTNSTLSLDRWFLAGAVANGKAFFGGGFSSTANNSSNVVDIYNAGTGVWTNTLFPLSLGPNLTATSIANKVFFAGGDHANAVFFNTVNIYDAVTNQWLPSTTLSQSKNKLTSLVYKDKLYFIGGTAKKGTTRYASDTIDVYDPIGDSWSVMIVPRLMHTSVTFQNPKQKRAYTKSTQAGCKMFLVPESNPGTNGTADTIAVYDFARDSWSYLALPHARTQVSIAAAKNKVYFAGGAGVTPATNGLWYDHVDIYTLSPVLQSAVSSAPATEHTFGTVTEGDQENIDIQLSNEGDYDLFFAATKITVTGDVGDFTVDGSTLPDTLSPTELINLPVTFSPTAEGLRKITISLYSNDPANPVYTFVVKGNGHIPVPDLKTSVSSVLLTEYDFGPVMVGNQEGIDIEVNNQGDKDLLFTSGTAKITLTGDLGDFTVNYSLVSDLFAPAQQENFPVTFTPTVSGLRQITLSLHSNDPDQPVYSFIVKGNGTDATSVTSGESAAKFLQAYPNPTQGILTLKSNSPEAVLVEVVNAQGKVVKTEKFLQNTLLDLSSLPVGIYFLHEMGASGPVIKVVRK